MIFCEKILAKIKISLHRSVEKLRSHKRYFCLFVCLGAFISEIELPRIPTYRPKIHSLTPSRKVITFYKLLFAIFSRFSLLS